MTGLALNSTESPSLIQNVIDNWPENWEYRDRGGFHGYSNQSVPSNVQNMDVEQVNYYDNYDIPDLPNDQSASYSNRTHGLLTATKVKVLGTNVYLWTVNYYDEFGRLVKQYKQHYQAGSVNAGNYDDYVHTYSFDNRLLTTKRQHLKTGTATTTITNRYVYDHVGRRLQNYQKINTGAEVQLIDDRYNAIGQLQDRALADRLQSTSLRYNERGWLKSSGSAQFSYELKYQDGVQPQFNGNISAQEWSVASVGNNTFNYKYDNLNRLTSGVATGMSEVLTYDFNGNIKTLKRDAVAVKTYAYIGNRLNTITLGNGAYAYDGNGNAIREGRTGMEITYNSLNLPSKVGSVSYTYDASGRKLRKTGDQVTDYVDGIQYTSGAIDVIQTEVGIARRSGTAYSYEYNLTDHLGNVRYTFNKNSSTGAITRVQSDDYYPFGLRKSSGSPVSLNNKYLYNGKELQEESGLYDYGARFYDPVVGRWNVVDRMSEYHFEANPYNYVLNNPMIYIDPYGLDTLKANNIRPIDWQNFKPKADVITLENVGITANRKNSNDNSGIYLGVLGLGMGQAENTLFNKETWYSLRAMKSYSQSFHGNQYEWTKGISKKLSVGLKIGGYAMGAYSIRKVNQEYNDGTIQYNGRPMSRESMLTEQASGLFSTVGGVAGAGWGIGWEIGRGIAVSPDYRMNIRPVLQDFIGIERDMYNQRDLRMKELINNISIK